MKKLHVVTLTFTLLVALSCKQERKDTHRQKETTVLQPFKKSAIPESITLKMEPKNDSEVSGTVTFTEDKGTVTMIATLSGLSQGKHAIHLHEKADCSAADATSTGGHWNPTFQPHGQWGTEKGYHKGDIGNLIADENGKATITFETGEWCIGCDDTNKNIVGKAVIVHQGIDDYTSQPSGAAGARIACVGLIQ